MNYARGGTVVCQVTVRNDDGDVEAPTSLPLTIYEPDGTLSVSKVKADLTLVSTGVYTYDFPIPASAEYGDWRYQYIPTNSDGDTDVQSGFFTVSPTYAAQYCSVADISRLMGGVSITSSSTPSISDVQDIINMHEDEIDQYTHHSWRSTLVENEYYNFDGFVAQLERFGDWSDRARVHLKHRKIRAFIAGTHKMEVWDGTGWIDFITQYTEGRGSDFWIDYERGILHFGNRYPWRMRHSIRMTYAYGHTTVHGDIKKACIMLTAAYLLQGDDYSMLMPEGTSNIPLQDKSAKWQELAYKLLDRHVELTSW